MTGRCLQPLLAVARAAVCLGAAYACVGPLDFNVARAESPPLPEHPRGAALAAANAGKHRTAYLLAAKPADPLMAKLITWRLLTRSDGYGRFDEAAQFLSGNPDWPRLDSVRAYAERSMPAHWSEQQQLAWFASHPPVTFSGKLQQIQALYLQGSPDETAQAARALWVKEDLPTFQEPLFLRRFGKFLRPEDEEARLSRLIRARNWTPAARQAGRLGSSYPDLVLSLNQLSNGRIDLETAVKRLPPELRDHPALTYEAARQLQRDRRPWGLFALLEKVPEPAPDAERLWWLRHWTARQLLEEKAAEEAYRIARAHGLKDGSNFAEAEWLSGWIALQFLHRPEVAFGHFQRMYGGVSTPVSASRGAYWSGRAMEAAGRREESTAWYAAAAQHGTAFYGQLAASRLGRLPMIGDSSVPLSAAQRAAFERRELVKVTRLLANSSQYELAKVFLFQLESQASSIEDKLMVAELARDAGRPDLALRIARQLRGQGVVLAGWLYPPKGGYPKINHRLDPDLVHAVIRQESGFYERAVSHAGARGLMQLMPATARSTARRQGISYSRGRLTARPDYNLILGTAYLAGLIERFNGSLPLALAAYNGGPGNVQRWVERFGDPSNAGVDVVDWIESIPFSETRNYVQRIIETIEAYRLLQGSTRMSELLSPGAKVID